MTRDELRERVERAIWEARGGSISAMADAALAAIAGAALDADDLRDAAAIITGAARAMRSQDTSDGYLAAAGMQRVAALLRALAEGPGDAAG